MSGKGRGIGLWLESGHRGLAVEIDFVKAMTSWLGVTWWQWWL